MLYLYTKIIYKKKTGKASHFFLYFSTENAMHHSHTHTHHKQCKVATDASVFVTHVHCSHTNKSDIVDHPFGG